VNFQEKLFSDTTYLRVKYPLPSYPCYHEGLYLEEYFCNYFIQNCLNEEYPRYYLPIFWTNIYLKNWIHNYKNPVIQCYLNTIPKDKKYFTVCQHDDAPTEKIDHLDIDVYSAGGNYSKGIPIPLICSPIPNQFLDPIEKSIFCSFVGSNTHDVRNKIFEKFKDDNDFSITSKSWQYNVHSVDFNLFLETTKKSIFTICARGYGKQSYRFYETLQLGSIPVYIYDNDPYLPFSDEIDYNSFCVVLNIDKIDDLKGILKSKTQKQIDEMLSNGNKIYNEYFKLDKLPEKIISMVNKK
jgi:hypothetical protein